MAVAVIMPRQGNTVESCIITAWNKKPGDTVTLQVYRSSTQQSATVELRLSEYSAG